MDRPERRGAAAGQETIATDVVVVGSGGAGLTAATVAARHGLDVLLVEKTGYFGGTTALSGGGVWVPGSSLAVQAGIVETPGLASRYVHEVVGPTLRADLLEAFLDAAPRMVDYLHAHTVTRFGLQRGFADWLAQRRSEQRPPPAAAPPMLAVWTRPNLVAITLPRFEVSAASINAV